MSFLLVLILAVSTRCIPGRCIICLTSTGGGVTAIGAMILEESITRLERLRKWKGTVQLAQRRTENGNTEKHHQIPTIYMDSNATGVRLHT
jgi:hypothetical protein